ncbi:MAG: arginine--tRNA ligase [Nitrospiraceae bacterium]|nr:arginine--tRNA ligase [Nitrospiraceae bacterium]
MNVFESLETAIVSAFPEVEREDLAFVPPPNLDIGDVALRTFELAKKLRMAPPQIATRIAQEVSFGPEVVEVTTAGPYVNFRVDRNRFARAIVDRVLEEGAHFGSNDSGVGKRVLLEHTSINPNAEPHLGRARNAMIGDSVTRLLRFEGHEVEVHYYVNDMGRQIGLLVMACEGRDDLAFDEILDLYVAANARAEAEPEFAAKGYELLAKMEEGDPETVAAFHAVTDLCIRGQLAVLGRLGITYDVFDRESKYVRDARLEPVLDALRAKDALFTDEDERLVVDLRKLGHEPDEGRYFVVMRSNGSSMYGYRDLTYTIDKSECGADLNLIALGEDHKLYFHQISLILQEAGMHVPEPIYYSYILLKDGKMSTRQGKGVMLSDFLDEAARLSAQKVEEQCAESGAGLSGEERAAIAAKVAVAAIRFAILRVGPNKNVIFDWESSLSFSGDTGPYVQYCTARINSILRKFGEVPQSPDDEFPVESNAEWALVTKLAAFPQVVADAAAQRTCATIANYALETARLFTTFYHECPVLKAEDEAMRTARAQVCAATRVTLENTLHLLGIEALERM